VRVPPTQKQHSSAYYNLVDVLLSGSEAANYNPANLLSIFDNVLVLPQIDIAPISPVYTDGVSDATFVTLQFGNTVETAISSNGSSSTSVFDIYTLHIVPIGQSNVYVQPSVLEFSAASSPLILSFQLMHTQPSLFGNAPSYPLQYILKFGGWNGVSSGQSVDVSAWLPLQAQQVLLRRYTVIPQFPHVLGWSWEEASFNITRANQAHLALVPHPPREDGHYYAAYGGASTAGGRVLFDPPVIVFEPLQTVQSFNVKAVRGNDESEVYYRIEWEIVGHPDDTYNYIEFVAPRASSSNTEYTIVSHFATWHTASASVLQLFSTAVVLLMILVCLFA